MGKKALLDYGISLYHVSTTKPSQALYRYLGQELDKSPATILAKIVGNPKVKDREALAAHNKLYDLYDVNSSSKYDVWRVLSNSYKRGLPYLTEILPDFETESGLVALVRWKARMDQHYDVEKILLSFWIQMDENYDEDVDDFFEYEDPVFNDYYNAIEVADLPLVLYIGSNQQLVRIDGTDNIPVFNLSTAFLTADARVIDVFLDIYGDEEIRRDAFYKALTLLVQLSKLDKIKVVVSYSKYISLTNQQIGALDRHSSYLIKDYLRRNIECKIPGTAPVFRIRYHD